MSYKKYIYSQPHGLSLLKKDKVSSLVKKILVFSNADQLKKFNFKVNKIKPIRANNKSEPDSIDIDKLIMMFLHEYYEKRKSLQGQIYKLLTKNNAKNSGVYSIDDMSNMLNHDILNRKSSVEMYKYPSKFTLARTLLHAQTSG